MGDADDRPAPSPLGRGSNSASEAWVDDSDTGGLIEVPYLDNRVPLAARLPRGSVLAPGAVKCIPGEGMPKRHNPHLRGDLVLRFAVDFPDLIPEDMSSGLDVLCVSTSTYSLAMTT